jgi:hypothetical protein
MPSKRSCSVWSRREIKYNSGDVTATYNVPSFPRARVLVDARPDLKRVDVTLLAFKTKAKVVKFHFSPEGRSGYDWKNLKAQVRYGVLTITIPKSYKAPAVPSTIAVKVAK